MSIIHSLINAYSRRRFALLFFSLLITMVAAPVFGAMGVSSGFVEAFLALNILAAALVTMFGPRIYAGVGVFALLAARFGSALLGYEPLLETSQAIGVLICLVVAVIILRFILSEGFVTSERIFAALSVYLLIGIVCAMLFCIFGEVWPRAFSFQGSSFVDSEKNFMAHMIYFSYVTLGTLGYGDIIPVSGPARALAVTESIVGQMYLAVVVARLVSLYRGAADRKVFSTTMPHQDEDPVKR